MPEPATTGNGQVYADFLLTELKSEYERRTSFQSRAVSLSGFGTAAVGLASGGLAVLFGSTHQLSVAAALLLLATLILFLASIATALYVFSVGQRYKVAVSSTYSHMVNQSWGDPDDRARQVTSILAAKTIITLRLGNNRSANWLLVGGGLQIGGLGFLIAALIVEFARAAH